MKFLNNYQLWCLFTTHVKLLIKAISIIRHFDCSVSETEKSHTFAWFQAKVNVSQIHQPRKPRYNEALGDLLYKLLCVKHFVLHIGLINIWSLFSEFWPIRVYPKTCKKRLGFLHPNLFHQILLYFKNINISNPLIKMNLPVYNLFIILFLVSDSKSTKCNSW